MKNINIREELIKMIDEWGIEVLYVRESKYIKCKCYNNLHRTGDVKCPLCQGQGYLTTIEKTKLIYDNNYTFGGDVPNKGMGDIVNDSIIFYMLANSNPKVRDNVYLTGWNKTLPVDVQKVCIIKSVDEIRLDNGKLEGYMVSVKVKPSSLQQANELLKSLSIKAKTTLAKGGKYIWPYKELQN